MTAAPAPETGRPLGAWAGLAVAGVLIALSFALPPLLGKDVHARGDRTGSPPLHGFWRPAVGPGTIPAVLLALLGVAYADRWARRASWPLLLLGSYVAGLAWLLALALV